MKITKLTAAPLGICALVALASTGCNMDQKAGESVNAYYFGQPLTVIVSVDGMVCNFCATNIDKTLAKLPGVSDVSVNLAAGAVILRATEKAPTDEALRQAVKDAGFEPKGITRSTEDFAAAKARLKAEALKKLDQ